MDRNISLKDLSFQFNVLLRKIREISRKNRSVRYAALFFISLGIWFFVSYIAVSEYIDNRFSSYIQQHSTELDLSADAVTYHFDRSITFLRSIPAIIADDHDVVTAINSFDYQVFKRITPDDSREFINDHNSLKRLNEHLSHHQKELDVNVIAVLAPNGVCLASSNSDTAESFVGFNYADREYFKSAMQGQQGRQYAVGRQTNVPGLFFSAPILRGDDVVGAVVVKINIVKFSQWFNRFECFVSDANGVIILSSSNKFEHYALVDAPVFRMSAESRDQQYRRNDFHLLEISRVGGDSFSYPVINLPGSDDITMLAQSQRTSDGYTIFTYSQLMETKLLRNARWPLTILLFIAGMALILLIVGIRLYLRGMRDALVAAQAANNAKSMFLANMSHEIRTPMNAIIGMSYLALQSDLAPKQKEQVTYIHTSAEALLGIINDILDFSKVEAGKMTLEQAPFVLGDSMIEVMQLLEPKLKEKGLKFFYDGQDAILAPDAPLLIGDRLRLRQVLTNLFSNAIKFTEKGFVRVQVSSTATGNTVQVVVVVEDSGIGMSEEQIARLFEEFSQADASTTRKYGGTGLGMTIAWKLVTLMGGAIHVESQLGQGSRFTVEIPFATAQAGNTPHQEQRKKIEVGLYDALKGRRILLVEDNPVNRLLAMELLAMKGVVTDCAGNGEEAIQKLQSLPPDTFSAVLMDLQMPLLDGYDTTQRIRSDPKFDNLPIIALSAHVMSFERERCSRLGMNGSINKPFNPEQLWHCLLRAIRKNQPVQVVPSSCPAEGSVPIGPNYAAKGIKFDEGLKRAGGDSALYAKVVQEVLSTFSSGWKNLLEFADQQKSADGLALAHNLQGVFGAIGAIEMQKALSSIEETFGIGADARLQILALEQPYKDLLEELRRYLDTSEVAKAENEVRKHAGPLVDAAWRDIFTAHLARGDFAALELWENNKNRMGGHFSSTDLELISRALQQFDFASALEHFNARIDRSTST